MEQMVYQYIELRKSCLGSDLGLNYYMDWWTIASIKTENEKWRTPGYAFN